MHTEDEVLELRSDITNIISSYVSGRRYNQKDYKRCMDFICLTTHYKNLDKEWYLLTKVKENLLARIARRASITEVLSVLPTITKDIKRDIVANGIVVDEKERIYIEGTKKAILAIVSECGELTREELLEKEAKYDHDLKVKSSVFAHSDSSGRVIGNLNKGMYGKTSGELTKFLTENGINLEKGDRFTDFMSDDLLRFRVAGLYISQVYCDRIYKNLNNDDGPTRLQAGQEEYKYTLDRTKKLGSIVKSLYKDFSGKTPYEEIRDTGYEWYPVIKGTFPNR